MAYKVTKKIPTGNGDFIPVGEIVDGSGWRNLKGLISNRFLTPHTEIPVAPVVEPKPKVKAPSAKG